MKKTTELLTVRYESQIRYLLNVRTSEVINMQDLITNALPANKFALYDAGDHVVQGIIGQDLSRSVRGNMRSMKMMSKKSTETEGKEEWYGKPEKKPLAITGEPIICYIVGGTCFTEIQSLNEFAEAMGRNLTIASTDIYKQGNFVNALYEMDSSSLL